MVDLYCIAPDALPSIHLTFLFYLLLPVPLLSIPSHAHSHSAFHSAFQPPLPPPPAARRPSLLLLNSLDSNDSTSTTSVTQALIPSSLSLVVPVSYSATMDQDSYSNTRMSTSTRMSVPVSFVTMRRLASSISRVSCAQPARATHRSCRDSTSSWWKERSRISKWKEQTKRKKKNNGIMEGNSGM